MYHSQCRIAVHNRIHNNADSKQIVDLIQCLFLIYHLFIDTEKMLYPAIYLRLDTCLPYMPSHFIHDRLNIFFPDTLTDSNLIYQIVINCRFQIFQRQIIQLDFDFGYTEPLCNGSINIQCLPGNTVLLFRRHMF